MAFKSKPAIERFYALVMAEPNTGCWLWLGTTAMTGGYGSFWDGERSVRAHRAAYEMFVGPVPPGLSVLHRCDVRCCVNPEHLFLGTHADNGADMVRKGRQNRGVAQHKAKLTPEDVREIRASSEPARKLAPHYGVSHQTINRARSGQMWRHLDG